MGWLDTKDECVVHLDDLYGTARDALSYAFYYKTLAYVHYSATELYPCLDDILTCLSYINSTLEHLAYKTLGHDFNADVIYFFNEFAGGEVTWKSIVEAWVKDDFEGRAWTIAVIDRMRQIIWNEPFDITWAGRPEQKEVV